MTVRRWRGDWQRTHTPPHAIHGAVAPWAQTLSEYRRGGVAMLGKRTARQWLKELGARRRVNEKGQR